MEQEQVQPQPEAAPETVQPDVEAPDARPANGETTPSQGDPGDETPDAEE